MAIIGGSCKPIDSMSIRVNVDDGFKNLDDVQCHGLLVGYYGSVAIQKTWNTSHVVPVKSYR